MPNTSRSKTETNSGLEKQSFKIYSFFDKNRRMPSYAEICKICGVKSKNTAHALVRKLTALKLLGTDSSGKIIPAKANYKTLRESENDTRETPSNLKLLGLVEAGFPTPSEESLHENMSLDEWIVGKKEATFMLKVKGDSMKDAGILNGDMVIVERTNSPKVGQIVIAEVDGAYTMKYLRTDSRGKFYLEPANENFENIYPKENMQINAVVKAVVRKY